MQQPNPPAQKQHRQRTSPQHRPAHPPPQGGQQITFAAPPRSTDRTWVVYDTQGQHDPKLVRKHAAAASANARKATIERKKAARAAVTKPQPTRGDRQLAPRALKKAVSANEGVVQDLFTQITGKPPAQVASSSEEDGLAQLVGLLGMVQGAWEKYSDGIREASLAQKAIRTMLWDSYSTSTVLFQAALFISGTHTNSCGLPPSATAHMGSAMLILRGASLEAVQAEILTSGNPSSTPVAIALLAGWERRFGDRASYDVHMQAWRRLAVPTNTLQESHVSTLMDVTLEVFRTKLDESASITPAEIKATSVEKMATQPAPARLPPGFIVFGTARAEARSLFQLVADCFRHPVEDAASIPAKRKVGMKIIAWSPTHTLGCETAAAAEAEYDQHELSALYHVRAALISLNGVLLQLCMVKNGVTSTFNFQAAMDVHTVSCQHLNTETLLGTKYEGVAFFTRFSLCAMSRDPDRDFFIRRLLQHLKLSSWQQVRELLQQYMVMEPIFEEKCLAFYRLITADPVRAIIEEVGG